MRKIILISDTGDSKEKIRVLLMGVELVTFWSLIQMLSYRRLVRARSLS